MIGIKTLKTLLEFFTLIDNIKGGRGGGVISHGGIAHSPLRIWKHFTDL